MRHDIAISVVEAVPMPALLIRQNERIETANEAAQGLLGGPVDGRHYIAVLRQPNLLDTIESTLQDGEARTTQYLSNDVRGDVTYRVSVRPVELSNGRGTLVCFEDTTDVERAGQMRRDFVANVSHELRTPLTALMGFIETLRGPAKNDAEARDRFLSIMENEASRMNRLVGDLLSLNRVESQERVRPTEQVDPCAIAETTIRALSPLAADAGVELQFEAPTVRFFMPGDGDQLRQVFTNLVENAVKYSGEGSLVVVRVGQPQFEASLRCRATRVSIRDTGAGISEMHLPRLTERFYRVDAHRSRERGGTGLGLAIVKHIVNRHRGRMRIHSQPGDGTEVTLILPVD